MGHPQSDVQCGEAHQRGPRWIPKWHALFCLCSLGLFSVAFVHDFFLPALNSWRTSGYLTNEAWPAPKPESDFKWSSIRPSRTLQWHRCYDGGLECARLDVPMDWLDPSDDQRVILAVNRLPAKTKANHLGSLFFNPGGPGGSGTFALKDHGRLLQQIAGDNYDIVSFDPRGIGASVPRLECWNSVQKRQFWGLEEVGVIDSHPGVLSDAFARAKAFSMACETMMNETGILRHVSTASHARDMLEILNQSGEEKLKYWGFSYGTILGGTFAAMYPDKVGRLVSDGNVDYKEWFLSEHINFLRDADKVLDAFFKFCHKAGPSKCAFYARTPSAVKDRLDALLERIRRYPVIVASAPDEGIGMPELINYSRVKQLITTALYQPIRMFPEFARILAALDEGNGIPFYRLMESAGNAPDPGSLCTLDPIPPDVPKFEGGTDDAFAAILCVDGKPLTDTVDEFEEYADRLREISSAVGSVNVLFRISCAGRQIRPKWRFAGPFEGNTSHPILYVANIADNVTPLVSARNNSAGFPNSIVLIQNSYGHTTLSAASTCTAKHIRSYFQNGTLPEAGSRCDPDFEPFENKDVHEVAGNELSYAIRELSDKANWNRGPRIS